MRVYALGDMHGRYDLLVEMLRRIQHDLVERPHPYPHIVCLGDYCDRGPDSRSVIDTLVSLKHSDMPASFLLGNHDTYVCTYLRDPEWFDRSIHWLNPRMGGNTTLASYGVVGANDYDPIATRDCFARALPPDHLAFFEDCQHYLLIGSYLFVHAGIRPGVRLDRQIQDDLIWIREPFLSSTRDFGFKVVHGHTIVKAPEHHPNRIAIDTGAYATGCLTCLVVEDDAADLLGPDGLRPLPLGSGLPGGKIGTSLRSGLNHLFKR
jgi:serine/threonine protein phosphatase 1